MIELNVVLKLYKHLIECVEQGVNKHTFYYKIKRIEIFKEHYLIKTIYSTLGYDYIFDVYEPLILISKNNKDIINDFVIHHFMMNEETINTYITPTLNNEYDFSYDYKFIDYIVRNYI